MFRLTRPSDETIRAHLERQKSFPYSYADVGATAKLERAPDGFDFDQNRRRLGSGPAVFEAACDAVRRWKMFELGWVELCWPDEPVEVGSVVGVLAYTLGIWSLSACRVVYTVDEPNRFGFAYGTLPGHVERGEERFSVERDDDGDIWYEIRAFSRPRHPLARLGYLWVRSLQRRFARDSMAVMQLAVGD